MLIETHKIERISEVVEAEVAGKRYEIKLCEECCLGGCEIDNPDSSEEEGTAEVSARSNGTFRSSGMNPEKCPVGQEAEGKHEGIPRVFRVVECCSEGGGADFVVPPLRVEQGLAGEWRHGRVAEGLSEKGEDDFSNFKSTSVAGAAESRNTALSSQMVPESDLYAGATSWVSLVQSPSTEIAIQGGIGVQDREIEKQKKLKSNDGTFPSVLLRGEDPSGKQRDRVYSDLSDQEVSLSLSEKYLSILKMVRRKRSKGKKDIRYQRRKELRAAGVQHLQEEGTDPLLKTREEVLEAVVEGQRRKVRKEAEKKVVRRIDSKEKVVVKSQRRKKRAELDRLKKSYLEELGKSNRTSQVSESETLPDVVSLGVDEEARKKKGIEASRMRQAGLVQNGENPSEQTQNSKEQDEEAVEKERRRLQREEAVERYKVALDLGVRGSLSEEGMIQLFDDHLQKEYEERRN